MKFNQIILTLIVSWSMNGQLWADMVFFDLTHEIPTFSSKPNPATYDGVSRPLPDLSKPFKHSKPIAGFYPQAILYPAEKFDTSDGYFLSRSILIEEHNGTHLDSTNHYVNNSMSLEPGSNPNNQRKSAEQLTIEELTGKIVLIDVSERVKKELEKNNGQPSPDITVTDFSNKSQATVRASDIEAIADQIENGVWLIARVGWAQFYYDGIEDWATSSYVNDFNHPGFTPEAIDKLIEIMDRKGVKISGIAADSWSTDSGEGAKGIDDNWTKAWQVHVRLYQRDILVVESLASLTELANAYKKDDCYLIVGGLKHVGGTGGPARVIATCK